MIYPAQVRGAGYAVVAGRPLRVRGQHRRRHLTALGHVRAPTWRVHTEGGKTKKKRKMRWKERRDSKKKDVRCVAPAPHTLTPARRWRGAGRGGTRATTAGPPPWTWPSRRDDVIIGGTVQGFESDSFLILVVRDERLGSIRFCL